MISILSALFMPGLVIIEDNSTTPPWVSMRLRIARPPRFSSPGSPLANTPGPVSSSSMSAKETTLLLEGLETPLLLEGLANLFSTGGIPGLSPEGPSCELSRVIPWSWTRFFWEVEGVSCSPSAGSTVTWTGVSSCWEPSGSWINSVRSSESSSPLVSS